jgi:hypothetical protein
VNLFDYIRKYQLLDLRNRLYYWRISLPLNAVAHLRKTSIEVYLIPFPDTHCIADGIGQASGPTAYGRLLKIILQTI